MGCVVRRLLLLHFLNLLQSLLICCEYVRVCHERRGPSDPVDVSVCESLRLVVAKGRRVGIPLGYVGAGQELPVGVPEDARNVGCEVDGGNLLYGMASSCGCGVEACFDGIILSGEHRIGCRFFSRDDEVCMMGGVVLLGVGEDERSVRGSSKNDIDM